MRLRRAFCEDKWHCGESKSYHRWRGPNNYVDVNAIGIAIRHQRYHSSSNVKIILLSFVYIFTDKIDVIRVNKLRYFTIIIIKMIIQTFSSIRTKRTKVTQYKT